MNTRDRIAEALRGKQWVRKVMDDGYTSMLQADEFDLADAVLPVVDVIAAERAAEAWDEGCEAGADHAANNGRLGIPHDPPSNPYARAAGLTDKDGQR